jgi:hypothetical protein
LSDADRGLLSEGGHGKVIEKTLLEQSVLDFHGVLDIVPFGGAEGIRTTLIYPAFWPPFII